MAEHPKVFISYSHDSPEHKQWVSELGAKLRHKGVDVILDQWDLGLGDDLTQFMEVGIRDLDRVLVICTDSYVKKANAREGGVGYEIQIVTSQLVKDLGINKFIPVIRQASGQEKMPTCLGIRVYIDFTDDSQFEEKFDELLRELYGEPEVQKPPLGKKPSFAQSSSGQEARPSEGLNPQLPDIPEQVESASDAYSVAFDLARAGDVVGWHQLVERIQPRVFNSLVQWRQTELDGHQPEHKKLVEVSHKAVEIISPLISVALMGVKSRMEQFRDQKSILYELLNIPGWSREGHIIWINIPYALGYVYHSLHGSLCLNTNQLDLALSLARAKIPVLYGTEHPYVWEIDTLMGWSKSFGPNCIEGWKYLAAAYKNKKTTEWLSDIFTDDLEYRTSLVAYYMALHIHELARIIDSGEQNRLNASSNSTSAFPFKVPLTFVSEEYYINQRAIDLLLRNPESLMKLWTSLNVTREQMEYSWRSWIRLSEPWLRRSYGLSFDTRVSHEHLFEAL